MKRSVFNCMKVLFSIVLINLFIATSAQELNEAKQKFLDGLAMINEDPQGALDLFNQCIDICTELGEEGDDTRIEAENRLSTCYYKMAYQKYKDKKYAEAIEGFKKTAEVAEKYNDKGTKEKAENYIPKLYFALGNGMLKKKDYDGALKYYAKTLDLLPTYAKAYYYQGLAYAGKKDNGNALASCKKAIEAAEQTNDTKTLPKAEKKAHNILLMQGAGEKSKGNYEKAIEYFKKATEFMPKSAEAYFQLAFSYNKLSKWEEAAQAATKSLEFDNNNDAKKARIYYELGMAQNGNNNSTEACDAFKNALYGEYTESAKYQIEVVLKCQ